MAKSVPYTPVEYDIADVGAIQALMEGTASPHQQKRALDWIIRKAAATYDLGFYPGADEGRRNTDFALGRQFVGQQIIKMTHLNTAQMRKNNE